MPQPRTEGWNTCHKLPNGCVTVVWVVRGSIPTFPGQECGSVQGIPWFGLGSVQMRRTINLHLLRFRIYSLAILRSLSVWMRDPRGFMRMNAIDAGTILLYIQHIVQQYYTALSHSPRAAPALNKFIHSFISEV